MDTLLKIVAAMAVEYPIPVHVCTQLYVALAPVAYAATSMDSRSLRNIIGKYLGTAVQLFHKL